MGQRRVKITAGDIQVTATPNDSRTTDLVWDALPIAASGSTWGDEIYFKTEVEAEEEDGVEVVGLGDVAYWPPGQALCLFFGSTPASQGDEIRPASAVNVMGRIEGDATLFKGVVSGRQVLVETVCRRAGRYATLAASPWPCQAGNTSLKLSRGGLNRVRVGRG